MELYGDMTNSYIELCNPCNFSVTWTRTLGALNVFQFIAMACMAAFIIKKTDEEKKRLRKEQVSQFQINQLNDVYETAISLHTSCNENNYCKIIYNEVFVDKVPDQRAPTVSEYTTTWRVFIAKKT